MAYICSPIRGNGVWRSWLAHLVWDQRVLCSSHSTPTKKETLKNVSFFVGVWGAEHPILLCLGALPLLYPAAPPSVFAFGKYHGSRRRAGARVRGGFLGRYGLGIFLDYRLREAVLVINVFGFCDYGSACGFSIHLQSGFQPLLYMPFFLMRE